MLELGYCTLHFWPPGGGLGRQGGSDTLSKFSQNSFLPHSKPFKPLSEKYQSPWKVHHVYIMIYLSFLDRFGVLRCPRK